MKFFHFQKPGAVMLFFCFSAPNSNCFATNSLTNKRPNAKAGGGGKPPLTVETQTHILRKTKKKTPHPKKAP
ncbi:hypothetical protein BS50DRAFT_574033 [Corynespora cassiicola Philippines]|uniref:Uncharacterized protein n=1 Tax=Corynespora cassiicola Philippines TaxID=1448308 RepID=A0A2T2NPG5_CORCC|nr:hypothetical protein BS50DRAFT_574033 [Corynespora cassiicola Philippines]